MIQRVQSVYLLLASAGVLAIPFSPSIATSDAWTWYIPVKVATSILIAVGCLVAIFLFKDRQRQKNLVTVDLVLTLLLALGLLAAVFLAGPPELGRSWPVFLPIVSLLFLLLARRAVTKDIELVKSMDRLR